MISHQARTINIMGLMLCVSVCACACACVCLCARAGHDDDDDHSPGVSPTVQRCQALLKRQEGGLQHALIMHACHSLSLARSLARSPSLPDSLPPSLSFSLTVGKIDPNKSFKAKQGNLTKLRKEGGLLNVDVDEGEQEG